MVMRRSVQTIAAVFLLVVTALATIAQDAQEPPKVRQPTINVSPGFEIYPPAGVPEIPGRFGWWFGRIRTRSPDQTPPILKLTHPSPRVMPRIMATWPVC